MAKKTLTMTCPEDVLAAVPLLMGFTPTNSLIFVSVQGCQMHARIDHPRTADEFEVAADQMVTAMTRNGVGACLLVSYVEESKQATGAREAFVRQAERAGIVVIDHLWVTGNLWRQPGPGGVFQPVDGVPFDVSTHPTTLASVVEGVRKPLASREALAETLTGKPDPVEAWEAALVRLAGLGDPLALAEEGRWVQERVRSFRADGARLDVDEAARMLAALERIELRDVVWAEVTRETARPMADLLADLLRRSQPEAVVAVAALLGFAAWQSGDGALAWCAVDRATAMDPGYGLALLVGHALTIAMPPGKWDGIDPEALPVFAAVGAAA